MQWSKAEIQETLAEVGRRTANNAEFRALALRDANAAIRQVTSKPIPENFKVQFVDNAAAHMTVVLPPAKSKEGVLSEEELELVSGGGGAIKGMPGGMTGFSGPITTPTQIGTNANLFYVNLGG
jgi:hypothetical protein